MVTLLVDVNLDGHAVLLERRLQSETWRALRDLLQLRLLHFAAAGLARSTADDAVWRYCQDRQYYLLTANRNLEAEDSLEATIRRRHSREFARVHFRRR